VHHIDLDLDTSSGIRFHPIEILFSIFIKIFTVVVFGIHPISVIIFEIVLNAMSLFNHSNLKISKRLNSILEKFIITPSIHLVHHSDNKAQTNSNYGFNFIIWDKLFGTYNSSDISQLNIGVKGYQEESYNSIKKALILPFENKD
jgi:sterol desaturase/sphingolipid hydroxylase (fatty acid hydroxylase superfamily)